MKKQHNGIDKLEYYTARMNNKKLSSGQRLYATKWCEGFGDGFQTLSEKSSNNYYSTGANLMTLNSRNDSISVAYQHGYKEGIECRKQLNIDSRNRKKELNK